MLIIVTVTSLTLIVLATEKRSWHREGRVDHFQGLVSSDQHLVRGDAFQGDILGRVVAAGCPERVVYRLGGGKVDADLGRGSVPIKRARGAVTSSRGGGCRVISACRGA